MLAFFATSGVLFAQTKIGDLYYNFDTEALTASVVAVPTDSAKYSGEITIPATVEHESTTYNVTSIGYGAFKSCTAVTAVSIPNSVDSIDQEAFRKTGITSIAIPSSIRTIKLSSFADCNQLTRVDISDLAAWCNIAFANRSNPLHTAHKLYLNGNLVTDLTIPEGITTVKGYAFHGATCIQSVTIPEGVTTIGAEAFRGCTGITSVTVSSTVATIGWKAFAECDAIQSVTCKMTTPPAYSELFHASTVQAIYVQYASLSAYKAADGWKSHKLYAYDGYPITINTTENGSVTADKTTALIGDEVTLTITANEGYQLENLTVIDADNNAIVVTDNKFTMPASDVTITTTFIDATTALQPNASVDIIRTEAGRVICYEEFKIFTLTGIDVTQQNGALNGIYIVKTATTAQKMAIGK